MGIIIAGVQLLIELIYMIIPIAIIAAIGYALFLMIKYLRKKLREEER